MSALGKRDIESITKMAKALNNPDGVTVRTAQHAAECRATHHHKTLNNPPPVADWFTVEGQRVLRVPGSNCIALKSKRGRWDILTLDPREYVCQVKTAEVYTWLYRRAISERS